MLNHIGANSNNAAQKAVQRFNDATGANLELFAPTYVVRESVDGKTVFRNASLTFHYVFVRGTLEAVSQLCKLSTNRFSFVLNRSSVGRYAVIDDRRMLQFKNIAKVYSHRLPCYTIQEIELEEGDLVEVTSGVFAGLTGRFIPKPRTAMGNIVLEVYGKLVTIAYDVKSADVRILEFAENTTRANDQIDAIVPHLLQALRLFHEGKELPQSLTARLSVFCRRLEKAQLKNRKLDARLQPILYAADMIIGQEAEAALHLGRFNSISVCVTNPWTRALNRLLLTIPSSRNPSAALEEEHNRLQGLDSSSKMRRLILDEYRHYTGLS